MHVGPTILRFNLISFLFLSCFFRIDSYSQQTNRTLSESTIRQRLETLSRIDPRLAASSPRISQLLDETADALRLDPRLISLVKKFHLKGYEQELLDIALQQPDAPTAPQAISYLLDFGSLDRFAKRFKQDPTLLLLLLARNASDNALKLLIPVLVNEELKPEFRNRLLSNLCLKRQAAIRILEAVRTTDSKHKYAIAQSAHDALNQTPWTEIRNSFAALLPTIQDQRQAEAFNIIQLAVIEGSIEAGKNIFHNPENTCIKCHQIDGTGRDFGPALSEIGTKLGKDALFDAILNPSSGISFDYEGWNITLNSGDELTGIVLSKTETQWTIKNLLGQIVEVPMEEIFEKQKMTTSLMPSGLGQLLGKDKLVDLVAYLSTLGK